MVTMEPSFFCGLCIHAQVFVYFVTLESKQMTRNFLVIFFWGWIEFGMKKGGHHRLILNESVDAVNVYKRKEFC